MEEEKFFRIRIFAPDLETLTSFLRKQELDLGERGPRRQEDGTIVVEAFVPERIISDLKKTRLEIEVLEDLTEVGKKRQAQVGKGDRFQGGRRLPSRTKSVGGG